VSPAGRPLPGDLLRGVRGMVRLKLAVRGRSVRSIERELGLSDGRLRRWLSGGSQSIDVSVLDRVLAEAGIGVVDHEEIVEQTEPGKDARIRGLVSRAGHPTLRD